MAYWWVNQNQTLRHEIEGGYLWSPKRNSNGAFNRFYENMKLVEPGDVIYSFAGQMIRYRGIATDRAVTSPKPDFGSAGQNWSDTGWVVPVAWRPLPAPIRPKDAIESIAPTLPSKYSPLTQSGDGLQSVYLAAVPDDMAAVLAGLSPASPTSQCISRVDTQSRNPSLRGAGQGLRFETTPRSDATTKQALIAARRGQGKFRRNVERIERGCRMTVVADPRFLRASHIKPWRLCKNNHERLYGYNGLLLTPTFDHLFDKGYITFEDDGRLVTSSRLGSEVAASLGLSQASERCLFHEAHRPYLAYHRSEVFLG